VKALKAQADVLPYMMAELMRILDQEAGSELEGTDAMIVPAARRTTKVIRTSKRPGQEPWEQRWNGHGWEDMPTSGGYENKLLDFALYRRGMYDPEFDLAVDEEDDGDEVKKPRRTHRQKRYGTIGGAGRMRIAAAMADHQKSRAELAAKADDKVQRETRQAELLLRWIDAKQLRGFGSAFYDADATAHSAMMRAMGLGRGCQGPLRTVSLDRITRMFEKLKTEGWNV